MQFFEKVQNIILVLKNELPSSLVRLQALCTCFVETSTREVDIRLQNYISGIRSEVRGQWGETLGHQAYLSASFSIYVVFLKRDLQIHNFVLTP
jgi:hypothetical protein